MITDAVSTQDWFDGELLEEPVSPSLKPISRSVDRAIDLKPNAKHAFYGCLVNGEGFILREDEALEFLSYGDDWQQVVRPYLDAKDLLGRPGSKPSRWAIDLYPLSLEDAEKKYPQATSILRARVKPHRDQVKRKVYRERWWLFAEAVPGMRNAIEPLSRFITAPQTGKRILFAWQQPWVCPSHATTVFAFDDDYAMGVLSSTAQAVWTVARCSTLEDRLRYTPTTVFMSFPWPDRAAESVDTVGAAAAALISHRDALCLEKEIGLTTLYNQFDEGAHRELRDLHVELDRAVADAYGWPRKFAQDEDELVRLLLERNLAIGRGEIPYAPFPLADAGEGGAQGQLA